MQEETYYHALHLLCGGEYKKLAALNAQHTSWQTAWRAHVVSEKKQVDPNDAWQSLRASGIDLVLREHPSFPPLLKEIPWMPFGIYVKGSLPPPEALTLAIVGTRRGTSEGRAFARSIAKEVAARGVWVVSGLALGIDAEGHTGALEANGKTLAVLAGGLDHVSPRTNEQLAARILVSGGALVSEYAPGIPPLPHRFIERNRIVSGLSRAILIVEAPDGSGSLATARFALDQNRDVLVIPGPVRHPNYAGSHELIRNGAILTTSAAHVYESLGINAQDIPPHTTTLSSEETLIVATLTEHAYPLPIDKIIELTNLKPNIVNKIASLLVIKGIIREHGAGYTIQ